MGFTRTWSREQGCVDVPHDAVLIDDVHRPVIPDIRVLDHRHAAVVECEPMAVQPRRSNRVILATNGVVHDHDP
jgi:hypothetical protein